MQDLGIVFQAIALKDFGSFETIKNQSCQLAKKYNFRPNLVVYVLLLLRR
jgi:hypothetical protein